MSRVSIARRIERLRQHHRPKRSLAGRIDGLSPMHRAYFVAWQAECHRIMDRYADEPGRAYELMADGLLNLPQLPREIADCLFPEHAAVRGLDLAEAYASMIDMEAAR